MNSYNDTGLNGKFWQWLSSALSFALGAAASYANGATLGVFSGMIDSMRKKLDTHLDNMSLWRSSNLQEPTAEEKIVLDAFAVKLTAFFLNTMNTLKTTLSSSNPNIAIVNNEMAKMCIVRHYYTNNETTVFLANNRTAALSQNAMDLRLELIDELFMPIQEVIKGKLGSAMVEKTIIANINDFNGLFANSNDGYDYQCLQYVNNNASVLPPNNVIGTPNNVVGSVKNASAFEPIFDIPVINPNPIIAPKPINQNPVLPATTETSKIDKTFKYISYGLLTITAFGVVTQIFKKKQQ